MDPRKYEQFGFETPVVKPEKPGTMGPEKESTPDAHNSGELEPSLEKLVDTPEIKAESAPEIDPEEVVAMSKEEIAERCSNTKDFISREDNVMAALDAGREGEFGADGRMRRVFRVASKCAGTLTALAHFMNPLAGYAFEGDERKQVMSQLVPDKQISLADEEVERLGLNREGKELPHEVNEWLLDRSAERAKKEGHQGLADLREATRRIKMSSEEIAAEKEAKKRQEKLTVGFKDERKEMAKQTVKELVRHTALHGINWWLERKGLEKFTPEEYEQLVEEVAKAQESVGKGKEPGKWGLEFGWETEEQSEDQNIGRTGPKGDSFSVRVGKEF